MAKELMEIGGFITEGAEIVNHDNTLSGNGTTASPLGVVPGYNETVLWSGSSTANATLSEPITGFERVKIAFSHNGHSIAEFQVSKVSGGDSCPLTIGPTFSNDYCSIYSQSWKFSNSTTFTTAFKCKEWWGNNGAVSSRDASNHTIYCIWGINRKENA